MISQEDFKKLIEEIEMHNNEKALKDFIIQISKEKNKNRSCNSITI